MPSEMPMAAPTPTAMSPTDSETREPKITRDRTSRPTSSVPNGCAADGGSSATAPLTAVGSYGARSGAKIATAARKSTSAPPMTIRGLRRAVSPARQPPAPRPPSAPRPAGARAGDSPPPTGRAAAARGHGPSGPDVVLAEDVEQARADLAHVHSDARGRERDRREDEPAEVVERILGEPDVAAGMRDPEHESEHEDEDEPEEEVRQRHARERQPRREQVEGAVVPHRGQCPDDEGHDDRQRDGREPELERRRHPLADRLEDRLVRADRAAEVAGDGARDPGDVLHWQRPVDAQLLTDNVHARWVGLLAGDDADGVARREMQQAEDDHRDEDRHRDHEHEAAKDVLRHFAAPLFELSS